MKSFDEYRNFYLGGGGGGIPADMPEPNTYKEFAIAFLCGLKFGPPPEGVEPKTPIEKYLNYAVSQTFSIKPDEAIPGETTPGHDR